MARKGKFEIRRKAGEAKSAKAPHYVRLVAANGEVLHTSEMYPSRGNARRAARQHQAAAATAEIVDVE